MNKINILDCTLRDGGYVNNFRFGEKAISDIINKLSLAGIEIIECGFLQSNKIDPDCTLYENVTMIKKYIGEKKPSVMYVAMIAYGDIDISEIEPYDGTSIDGIRLTFHGNQVEEAITFGKQLKEKGYAVFMQPVGTLSYDDSSLIYLIKRVNEMRPFAFYIVDTLGTMYRNDLLRMFYLIDNNLNKNIAIGFHSHNNLQLSFSNAQELTNIHTKRRIIIDSSVQGMGRASGNLCTEIFADYLNKNIAERYDVIHILEIVDCHINAIFNKTPWGYSVPYYISAIHSCHPNYASYLLNKKTISVKNINSILKRIETSHRYLFNSAYIENLYLSFQEHSIEDFNDLKKLSDIIGGRDILIVAPGKTVGENKQKLNEFVEKNKPYVISVNFLTRDLETDAVFVSNIRRFQSIDNLDSICNSNKTVIVTSNIVTENPSYLIMNYIDYINKEYTISDNAGLMLLNILKKISVKKVFLAGFDGVYPNNLDNGYTLLNTIDDDEVIAKNKLMSERIAAISETIDIEFLTKSQYRSNHEI